MQRLRSLPHMEMEICYNAHVDELEIKCKKFNEILRGFLHEN